jgi:DnaK suppressor protein
MATRASISHEMIEGIRARLLERRRGLFDDVDGVEDDLRAIEESREAEPESRAQAEAIARLLNRAREKDRAELEDINRALAKIPAGAYGVCERCQEPIGFRRLRAVPATRHCIHCGRELEAAGPSAGQRSEPRAHRAIPAEYGDMDDEELAEAVREWIATVGDPDLLRVQVRCHGGVVRLSGDLPSEPQRQVLTQIVVDGMGLELLDRLRVIDVDRERPGRAAEEDAVPAEERVPAGRGMQPLAAVRPSVPEDEGEPSASPPDSPLPETQ